MGMHSFYVHSKVLVLVSFGNEDKHIYKYRNTVTMTVNLMRKPGRLEAMQQPAACGGNPGGDTPVRAGTVPAMFRLFRDNNSYTASWVILLRLSHNEW